jgi:hypothetical protein
MYAVQSESPQVAGAGFTEHALGIRFEERGDPSLAIQCLFGLFGLFGLAAAAAIGTMTNWLPLRAALMVPVLAVSVMLAWLFLMVALVVASGRPQMLYFDRATRRLQGRARHYVVLTRQIDLGFESLGSPTAKTDNNRDDAPLHTVCVDVKGQQALELGLFDDINEAEWWSNRLAKLLGAEPAA